jgi:hypothetical protein
MTTWKTNTDGDWWFGDHLTYVRIGVKHWKIHVGRGVTNTFHIGALANFDDAGYVFYTDDNPDIALKMGWLTEIVEFARKLKA